LINALLISCALSILAVAPAHAYESARKIPGWLAAHVGNKEGEIPLVVLERARSHYYSKVSEGKVANPCYTAMDATRPHQVAEGKAERRFFVICERQKSFHAISSGHGSGRKIPDLDPMNDKRCAKHFSNAEGSLLTTGGKYVTGEIYSSFKGLYIDPATRAETEMYRKFIEFHGEGETENSRQRDIGGHAAMQVRNLCLKKRPEHPKVSADGYVVAGEFEEYTDGRSNGCTSWSPADAERMMRLLDRNPTTLYIYPERRDIEAVARAVREGKNPAATGVYWNSDCLREIQEPRFWNKTEFEPLIQRHEAALKATQTGKFAAKKVCANDEVPQPVYRSERVDESRR
jgi:hypothetical protein